MIYALRGHVFGLPQPRTRAAAEAEIRSRLDGSQGEDVQREARAIEDRWRQAQSTPEAKRARREA